MRMRLILPLIAVFSAIVGSVLADTRVRHVEAEKDQIVTVKTAIGVATIIQVPDKPNSVVVGDMNGFKVEYLDTAITIKPLSAHAKSNLYIYTDYRRFNVQLVTGSESSADYVVYLLNPKAKTGGKTKDTQDKGVRWKPYVRSMKSDELTVKVNRLGEGSNGMILIDFQVKSPKEESIDPSWFWLTQRGESHPIQRLILSSLKTNPKSSITGLIEILKSDLNDEEPLRIELRRKKTSYLTIQGVNGWKF